MRTVLIIDDNPAVAQALTVLFSLHDIRTLTALTPQKGLAAAARERVDLVFELGTPRPEEGHCLFAAVRLPTMVHASSGNGRAPDPDVWRQPRLVRVWGQNASLCQSIAEQRFGSKRELQLIPIDEHQRAKLHI